MKWIRGIYSASSYLYTQAFKIDPNLQAGGQAIRCHKAPLQRLRFPCFSSRELSCRVGTREVQRGVALPANSPPRQGARLDRARRRRPASHRIY